MKKKTLLRLILALLLAVVADTAWASVTVNVRRTDSSSDAPYIYAWVNDGGEDVTISDPWPGTEMTSTTTDEVEGNTWFSKSFPGYSSIYVIISDNGNTQTSDLTVPMHLNGANASSTTWLFYNKNGGYSSAYGNSYVDNMSDKYDIPVGVTRENGKSTVYFINTNNWTQPYVQYTAHDGNGNQTAGTSDNNWHGIAMTQVGVNSNGWSVWVCAPSLSFTPDKVNFNDGNDWTNSSGQIAYHYHGYYTGYDYSCLVPEISSDRDGSVYNNAYWFRDANMRAALADATGVPASTATTVTDGVQHKLAPWAVTVLDLSNRNISTLGGNSANAAESSSHDGIRKFTHLQELYVQGNNLDSIAGLHKLSGLKILDASNNSIKYANFVGCPNIEEINLSNNSGIKRGVNYGSISNFPNAPNLSKGYLYVRYLSHLKKLNLSYCGIETDADGYGLKHEATYFDGASALEDLDVSHNSSLTTVLTSDFTSLKKLNVSNCKLSTLDLTSNSNLEYLLAANNTSADFGLTLTSNHIHVKWVDLSGCTKLTYITNLSNLSGLQHLDMSGCTALTEQFNSTRVWPTNNPSLQYLNLNGSGASSFTSFTDGWSSLDSLYVGGAASHLTSVTVSNHAPLGVFDVSGNTKLATIVLNGTSFDTKLSNSTTMADGSLWHITGLGDVSSSLKLDLRSNNFSTIPTTVGTGVAGEGLGKVETLIVSGNPLTSIDGALSYTNAIKLYAQALTNPGFTQLTYADNVDANGTAIGPSRIQLSDNTYLTKVNLSNNGLKAAFFANCTALQEINVSNNKLNTIAAHYNDGNFTSTTYNCLFVATDNSALASLKKLNVSNNQIEDIGTGTSLRLNGLTALEELDLSYNSLVANTSTVKSNFSQVPALKKLNVSHNTSFGGFAGINSCTNLEWLDASYCDIYPNFTFGSSYINPSTHTHLAYLNLNNSKITSNDINPTGYAALETYLFNNNLTSTSVTTASVTNCPLLTTFEAENNGHVTTVSATGCPALTTLKVGGNTALSEIVLTGNSYTNNSIYPSITGIEDSEAANLTLDVSDNAFTAFPTFFSDNETAAKVNVLKIENNNLSSFTGLNANFPGAQYLYAKDNNFTAANAVLNGNTTLKGLAVSNKSGASNGQLTTFVATNNTVLAALDLASNTAMDSIKVNYCPAMTQTAENGTLTNNGGLYIKNMSSLRALDIAHNNFKKLGQNNTTQGLTALTHLYGHHNKFTTFSNSSNTLGTSGNKNYRPALAKRPSLEHLTALKHLDLSYNELIDSVHLYRNTNLEWLNVSHNRKIIGSWDTEADYKANSVIQKQKGNGVTLSFPSTAYDPGAYADTVGLRMLDLIRCNQLKYLDVSYTCITQTAAPYHLESSDYMNNWAHKKLVRYDGTAIATTDDDYYGQTSDYDHTLNSSETKGDREGHYMRIWGCPHLETIYADYNGMKSIGIGTPLTAKDKVPISNVAMGPAEECCPAVKRISIIQSRGQDPGTMQGNLSIRNPQLEYYDVSYSDFDLFRVSYASAITRCNNLKYLNVSGNFTKNNVGGFSYSGQDLTRPINHLFLEEATGLVEVKAVDCPYLQSVHVSGLTNLSSLDLSQGGGNNSTGDTSTRLTAVYADNTGLPFINMAGVHYDTNNWAYRMGEETATSGSNETRGKVMAETADLGLSLYGCTALTTLYADNNNANDLNFIDVSGATGLTTVHASGNHSLTGTLGANGTAVKFSGSALQVFRVYDNALTGALDMSNYASLDSLDCYNTSAGSNKLTAIDVSAATALSHIDFSNASKYNANSGNRLQGISFAANNTSLSSVKGDNNNLFYIEMPTPSNGTYPLATLTYANNHINGIDLSKASGSSFTHTSTNNGRCIVAETGHTSSEGNFPYLQLSSGVAEGGTFIGSRSSDLGGGTLAEDGFDVQKASSWTGGSIVQGGASAPMRRVIDASKVKGNVLVLTPSSTTREVVYDDGTSATESYDGSTSYSYDTGNGTANYYLDYTWDPSIVTGIDDVEISEPEVSVKPIAGGIEVNAPEGTVIGVFDMAGRSVARITATGTVVTVDNLAPGIYIVNGQKVRVN